MKIPNKVYDVLKWLAIVFLPALSTFVAVVFNLWELPKGDIIAQTITAFGVFLGAILVISDVKYKQGGGKDE